MLEKKNSGSLFYKGQCDEQADNSDERNGLKLNFFKFLLIGGPHNNFFSSDNDLLFALFIYFVDANNVRTSDA